MHKVINDMGGAGDQNMKDVFLFTWRSVWVFGIRASTDRAWSRAGVLGCYTEVNDNCTGPNL